MPRARDMGRIVLSPMKESLRQMAGADPPALSIDKARQRLGPELHRLIAKGWLDDDIIRELQDQNPNDVIELLKRSRADEQHARRASETKKKAKKALKHASSAPTTPLLGRSASTALMSPTQGEPDQPSLPPSASPPLQIAFEVPGSDAEQVSHFITRNRGIRRPE